MKVNFPIQSTTFKEIKPGEVFIDMDTFDEPVALMRIDFKDDDREYDGYAARLGDGGFVGYFDEDVVTKAEAETTIKLAVFSS